MTTVLRTEPHAGYASGTESDLGDTVLYVTFDGSAKAAVFRWTNSTENDHAAAMRSSCLLDAVCRFWNAGGTPTELQELVAGAVAARASGALPDAYLAPGVSLKGAYETVQRHDIFHLPDGNLAIVPGEDSDVEYRIVTSDELVQFHLERSQRGETEEEEDCD